MSKPLTPEQHMLADLRYRGWWDRIDRFVAHTPGSPKWLIKWVWRKRAVAADEAWARRRRV